MNNILPKSAIEGSSVIDITSYIFKEERINYDMREKILDLINRDSKRAQKIVEMMFDFTAEAFLNRLNTLNLD